MLSSSIIANTASSASLMDSLRLHLIQAYTKSLCHLRQILTAHQTFPNLLRISFSTCRHPYPGESLRCICLLLHEAYQPSPNVQRFGTRFPAHAIFHWFPRGQPFSRGCNVRFMLRPVELFAPLRWPPLLSRGSGAFTSELSRIWSPAYESDIATWVNRQFPGRDFHPLETQHYGLRTY